MSRTLFSLAGFQVITIGRFWVIAEVIRKDFHVITVSRREQLIRSPGSLQVALVEFSEPKRNAFAKVVLVGF